MNKKKKYNRKVISSIILGLIIIIVGIIVCCFCRPLVLKNSLSTVEFGNYKVKLNDKVKKIDMDFNMLGIENIDDPSDCDYVSSDDIKNLKIKNNYIWLLEKNNLSDATLYLKGANTSNKEINIENGKVEYIRVKIYSYDSKEKITVFDNLKLGESSKNDVLKKVEKLSEIKGVVVTEISDKIFIRYNDNLYVEFIFENSVLNEFLISSLLN